MFPVERDGFLLFPVGEEWFSRFMRFMRIPSSIFDAVKLMKFLTLSFYTWFSV